MARATTTTVEGRAIRPDTHHCLFGPCATATQVEWGEVQSTTSPADWHQACIVGTEYTNVQRDQRGVEVWRKVTVTLCTCECHTIEPQCWACHEATSELDPELRQCVDRAACDQRLAQLIEQNPALARYREYKAVVEMERAERGESQPRPRNPARPNTGRCEHCGEPTKGGRFVAGHDAKLKGILARAAQEGDIRACAELLARDWYKPHHADDTTHLAAVGMLQEVPTHELVERRTKERIG